MVEAYSPAEELGFTKVKIVLKTTKLICKAALNFEVIFMPGLNIELDDDDNNNNNNKNNNNNILRGLPFCQSLVDCAKGFGMVKVPSLKVWELRGALMICL